MLFFSWFVCFVCVSLTQMRVKPLSYAKYLKKVLVLDLTTQTTLLGELNHAFITYISNAVEVWPVWPLVQENTGTQTSLKILSSWRSSPVRLFFFFLFLLFLLLLLLHLTTPLISNKKSYDHFQQEHQQSQDNINEEERHSIKKSNKTCFRAWSRASSAEVGWYVL